MDPNETLRLLRETALHCENDEGCRGELANAALALDGWLSKGGFLPKAWARPANVAPPLPEQLFEVRVLTMDGQQLTVGRRYDYAKALADVALLKSVERVETLSRLDIVNAVVVPVEVLP